jgi:predicted metal-dependent HD superfamily phosphohydrolase
MAQNWAIELSERHLCGIVAEDYTKRAKTWRKVMSNPSKEIYASWNAALNRLGVPQSPEREHLFLKLRQHYRGPDRHYHDWGHIGECTRAYADSGCTQYGDHDAEIRLAIIYHDVIYDTRSKSNEADSANIAATSLSALGVTVASIDRIHKLIMATVHTGGLTVYSQALLADVDLSMLAKPWEEFAADTANIRKEFSHVPEADFRAGRAKFLRVLYDRMPLYYTASFQKRCEQSARDNIVRSIAELESTS